MSKVKDKYMQDKQTDTPPPTETEKGNQEGLQTKQIGRVTPEDHKMFWGPLDKGANKPSFCYPDREQVLKNEVADMERNLAMGYVSQDRRLAFESTLKAKKERIDGLAANTRRVRNMVNDNKDAWAKRRDELGKEIRNAMPSRKDVEKRRVNPHRVAKAEMGGLGALKKEFIVISRALGEESNVSFLQRD